MIRLTFNQPESFHANLDNKDGSFDVSLKKEVIHEKGDYDEYTGEYVVTPGLYEAQTLPTKEKVMRDDVTIEKVPHFKTSNEFGETFYIGEL